MGSGFWGGGFNNRDRLPGTLYYPATQHIFMGLSCNIFFSGYLSYNIFRVFLFRVFYGIFPDFLQILSSVSVHNIFSIGGGTLSCNIFFQGIFIDIFFPVYPYLWYLSYPYNYYIPYVFQFFITQFFQFIYCEPCFLFCQF